MTIRVLTSPWHLAILAVLISGSSGCELVWHVSEGGQRGDLQSFEVHLNSQFSHDRVQVKIDGEEVFDERITTEDVWSLAKILKLERPRGQHRISVVVNGQENEETFSLTEKLFIHVWYRREAIPDLNIPDGISIVLSREHPMYD